jgi:hypothetical protein
MAELSADALAIVDRLKREGDLSRNSGTNSIRSVKIELSKFEDIFKTISSNISVQNDILKLNAGLAKEAAKNSEEEAERSKSEDQFEKLEPKTKNDDDNDQKSKLVSDEENKKINSMGDAIASALSFKNLALAGAGLFVGYNFLKGFIDEKTGGGFTEFENNIGPFAKKLPIIGAALDDLPATFEKFKKTMLDDFPDALKDIQINIKKMSDSVAEFVKVAREKLEEFASVGGLIRLFLSTITPLAIAYYTAKTIANLTEPDGPDRRRGGARPRLFGPLLKGLGVAGALTYSKSLGPSEDELQAELKRRREMGPTIDNAPSSPTQAANTEILKKSEQSLNPSVANEKVDARPLITANRLKDRFNHEKQTLAVKKWDAEYSQTHNVDGTPKVSRAGNSTAGGGRGFIVEKPGERAAYMQARADREAASLEEINKKSSDMSESISSNSTNRRNGLNTVAGNSGGGSAVIINAPVSAPSSINMTNGGSSVNQLSISGGGGAGLGPSMLPYGLTNAYN